MTYFQKYTNFYDVLYQDKNYSAECDFLEKIFKKYSEEPIYSILDLGCGTGNHAIILGERGYQIVGIDLSSEMIKLANQKLKNKKIKVRFFKKDIRNFNLKRKFSAAIAMFAVISYLNSKKDLILALQHINQHIKKRGLFIFDCWFGPAVRAQKPERRIKIVKKNNQKIIRIAIPTLNYRSQTVNVKYEIIKTEGDRILENFKEVHKMRYFFLKEIKHYLKETGFEILEICPFGELNEIPTKKNWNITVISKKYE